MTKTILVIGHVWPEPTTTAAGTRMQQLLEYFMNFGHQVTFASTATKNEYSLNLKLWGIMEVPIRLNHHSFDEFIQKLKPDVVIFDRFMVEEQFGWRVAEFAPNAIRILNTEDLHSLRRVREEAYRNQQAFNLNLWANHEMTLREVASIYRCDLSLMVSTFEMDMLQNKLHVSKNLLLYLPLMLDAPSAQSINEWPGWEERQHFITVGNGKHAPNVDSVKILKKDIWPIIRKQLPKVEIHVYGAYLPQMIQEIHAPKQGFFIKGWVENLDETIQHSRVLLAPIPFGAGIKGKLMDAMKNGTPSITTSIGAEGMHGDQSWNGVIANDWDTFASAAVEFYQNQGKWEHAQINGINLLHTFFDKEKLQKRLARSMAQLGENLDAHREQNFIGRLLRHQTLNSTKYMAKWIEEKNKEN